MFTALTMQADSTSWAPGFGNSSTVLTRSYRWVDFVDVQYVRISYDGVPPSGGTVTIRVEWSPDGGGSWLSLVPTAPAIGTEEVIVGPWEDVDPDIRAAGDVLLRAVVTHPTNNATVTVYFVDIHFR